SNCLLSLSRVFLSRAVTTSSQPCSATAWAKANPMPRLAPVTSVTLPRSKLDPDDFLASLNSVRSIANQREEFGPCLLFLAEAAQHGRSYRGRVLLFDTAHHHAEVPGFNN